MRDLRLISQNVWAAENVKRFVRENVLNPEFIIESIFTELELIYLKEYRFNPKRRWRADYYLPDINTICEVEGATWAQGRHTRGKGYGNDCEKYNSVSIMGFKLLRYTTDQIKKDPLRIERDLKILMEK